MLGDPRSLEFPPWSNQWNSPVDTQWNSSVDTTSSDPRQYGNGLGEVIPSSDGTDFRRYERRVRLFVFNTRVAPERERLVNFWSDSKDVLAIRLKAYRTWKHRTDHLKIHFEQEIKEYEPLRDTMLMAIHQAHGLRGGVPLLQKQSGAFCAQVVEAQDEEDEGTSSRKMRLPTTRCRSSTRKQWP